tara:strand:+ start:60 stop:638 length:579 start_codon:yes stop_codon:yes gene_type:complete
MNEEDYLQEVSKMDRPIAGMSLTNNPDNPAPYEQPPQFTNVHEASLYLWDYLTEDEQRYEALMMGISKGVPVMTIVEVILFEHFQDGMWNPDLMMMLAEPLAYMLIALAERLDLDIKIDNEEEEGDVFGANMQEDMMNKMRTVAQTGETTGVITSDMKEKMQELPEISLLEKPQEEEAPTPENPSLMAQPTG